MADGIAGAMVDELVPVVLLVAIVAVAYVVSGGLGRRRRVSRDDDADGGED